MSLDDWSQLDFWGTDLEFPPLLNTNDSGLGSGISASEPTNNSNISHSFPRGSYEIFRDLVCPGPFLHAPESNSETVFAKVDQILQFSRDAMERLKRLLKCSYTNSGHRVTVHASIISRILIWYEQAAGVGSGSTDP